MACIKATQNLDLDDLRRAVDRRRKAREVEDLKRELRGQNEPVDFSVTYITVKELSDLLKVSVETIRHDIRAMRLHPRMVRGRRGQSWGIHPDEAVRYAEQYHVKQLDVSAFRRGQ
jgi:hypothetical protein